MFLRFIVIMLAVFIFAGPPARAQIIDQTPEGGGEGGGADGPEYFCSNCCSGAIVDTTCCRDCGCLCLELPSCAAFSYMRGAGVPLAVNTAVLKSVVTTFERLSTTGRGKVMRSVMVAQAKRLADIYEKRPPLQRRTGAALARFWPQDMWTDTGADAHKVSREALRELRQILTAVAETDMEMGGSDVALTIERDVLPNLTPSLIGKPYHEAFDCFVGAQTCR